jgi:hypothetical protein
VIACPGVADGYEMPYEPLVVLTLHCVVEVGTVAEVMMHAPVAGAPDGSFTMPVIVIALFVAVGLGVGVALRVSVRSGVGVGVRTGVGVGGADVRTGDGDADADG